jgi:hypothetical protein
VGVPLIIVWVGCSSQPASLPPGTVLIIFERKMAIWLLHEDIPPITISIFRHEPVAKICRLLKNPSPEGSGFSVRQIPMGVISFVALVTLAPSRSR